MSRCDIDPWCNIYGIVGITLGVHRAQVTWTQWRRIFSWRRYECCGGTSCKPLNVFYIRKLADASDQYTRKLNSSYKYA